MDGFETPYEDFVEVDFINCEICNRSIRGETLYKLHITNPAHLKNEEALVAAGKIPRQQSLPVFDDIIQFLDYLKLDEPIIGLNYLKEEPCDSTEFPGLKYYCTLCKVHSFLTESVQHVIGRKHRQRVLETYRPDLISWDPSRPQTISGKLVRAKAEVAERQDGPGKPMPLARRFKNPIHIKGDPESGHGSTLSNFGPYSKATDRVGSDNFIPKRYEDTFANNVSLGDGEIFTERYEQDRDPTGYLGAQHYEQRGSGDFSSGVGLQDQDRRQYGQSQNKLYTDVFGKPTAQKDVLKEFYTEELRREKLAKAQQEPQREYGARADQRSYSTSLEGSHDNYRLRQDYRHEEILSSLKPSKVSPSRSSDEIRKGQIAHIPDPFMRFLKGESSHELPKERKRKSRFSDATAQELRTAQEMFTDEYGPPSAKFSSMGSEIRELNAHQAEYGPPSAKFSSMRSEIRDLNPRQAEYGPPSAKYSSMGSEIQELNARQADHSLGLKQMGTYRKDPLQESSEKAGNIFEMLNNIEIEDEDDANFLKERIHSVLREFKARKAEKAVGRYERTSRESKDIRRAKEPYSRPYQESYEKQMLVEELQERKRPSHPEARYSNRKPNNDGKIWHDKSQPQHDLGYDMADTHYDMPPAADYDLPASDYDVAPSFPESFQEPLQPRNHPSFDDFSGYQSSESHHHLQHEPGMNRPPHYSRNLDKITSTLLELVKRK